MTEAVVLSREGPVAVMTLNRPEVRNALGPEMVEALGKVLQSLAGDPAVRAVVLTGAGSAFSAGADLGALRTLRNATPAENDADSRRLLALYRAAATFPRPLVGAVAGPALAGGCGLATTCDVILAGPRARFGYPEVRIGFVAAMVLVFLARQVGERTARELLLSGRALTAEEACAAGLVHRVVPEEELLPAAVRMAASLAEGAPSSLALTKELLWHTSGLPVERALHLARVLNVFARTSPDMREGLDAFFEKRSPSWPGP
jgi:methylglutaconyl-CoA hydratase